MTTTRDPRALRDHRDLTAPAERTPGPSVRVTWWYTWLSVLSFLLVGNGFVIFFVAAIDGPPPWLRACDRSHRSSASSPCSLQS